MGGELSGFFGVLHRWGRTLDYHLHIHYIAVGGAFSSNQNTWHPSRIDFQLPARAPSRMQKPVVGLVIPLLHQQQAESHH